MNVIDRLDEAIRVASNTGATIDEIDLTSEDYADLMAFVAQFDEAGLTQMQLDMVAQTYKDYPLRYDMTAEESLAQLDDGGTVLVENDDET